MTKSVKEQTGLDQKIRQWISERGAAVPGLSVCIRDANGDIVFNNSYGVHDRGTKAPLRTDIVFPVASQSKVFTAAAVMLLVEKGQLNLDNKVAEILPQFSDPRFDHFTLRDALSHKTNFLGFWPMNAGEPQPTIKELAGMRIKDAAFSETSYAYSNGMYALLGLVIEKTSGRSYVDFVQAEIIDKAGISGVYPCYNAVPAELRGRIPTGYNDHEQSKPEWRTGLPADSGSGNPACGFYASPEGISAFYYKLCMGQILKPETVADALMSRVHGDRAIGVNVIGSDNQLLNDDKNPLFIGHALGDMAGHAGSENGYASETRFNPKTGYTVSVMRTRSDEEPWDQKRMSEVEGQIGIKQVIALVYSALTDAPTTAPDMDEYKRTAESPKREIAANLSAPAKPRP